MQLFRDNKMTIYGGIFVILAIFAYFTFFAEPSTDALLTTTEDTNSAVSRDLLVTLSNLNVIRLDETLFKDAVFVSLSDFGVIIPKENVGRRNPFAPL